MRFLSLALVVFAILQSAGVAFGQLGGGRYEGDWRPSKPAAQSEATKPAAVPASWYYAQLQETYDNPNYAVRKKAERRAALRQQRIAVTKAMGHSRQRPNVYYTPFGSYWPRTFPYNRGYPYPLWVVRSWDGE